MAQQVIEGIWEEVAAQAPQLRGHRVRVTILDVGSDTNGVPSQSASLTECLVLMGEAHGHSGGRKWTREDLYSDESLH